MGEIFPRGPYLLDIPYLTSGMTHHLKINCDTLATPTVGQDPDDIAMRTKGSVPDTTLHAAANALWTAIRQIFSNTTLASVYSLFKTNEANEDLEFISGGSLTTPNGGSIAVPTLMWQLTMTYRSGNGHIGKVELMETVISSNDRYPFGGGSIGETVAIKNYVMGANNIIMARDRSFPIAPLNEASGQNERLFRKRHRF